jgi:hypothetical protein
LRQVNQRGEGQRRRFTSLIVYSSGNSLTAEHSPTGFRAPLVMLGPAARELHARQPLMY